MRASARPLAWLFALALARCGGAEWNWEEELSPEPIDDSYQTSDDSGFEEEGDAGSKDAGANDGGKPDGGKPDAGKPDGGKPDAGKPDAGASSVYLSDLNWTSTSNITNGPNKDKSGWDPHAVPQQGGYKSIEIASVKYSKGVSWFPKWGTSWVQWKIANKYSTLTMKVRIDDEKNDLYEWGVVDRSTGKFLRLERPPGGFRAKETNDQFRIGGGGTLAVIGDGKTLLKTAEFYAYGAPIDVTVDVTGVDNLKIQFNATHHEQANAPHRNGLTSTPALVEECGWHDLIDLANAKLQY